MKHSLQVTLILLTFFLLAQMIGLGVIYNYIDHGQSMNGETIFKDLPIGERPEIQNNYSYIYAIVAIGLGTMFVLFLLRHKLTWVWRIWFLMAIALALIISFTAFIPAIIATVLGITLAVWRIFKPNFWVQNLTELFIYGGLAAIFVPLFSVVTVSILMVIIAFYDAYAVWKSKHMITLAKEQTKAKVFAGLYIPYTMKLPSGKHSRSKKGVKTAILGGGDIGFPLIFAGVIMVEMGVWQSMIIPFFALAGLAFLLLRSDEKKFYPAMPFISTACLLGLGLIYLIQYLS
ncbi:MAG: presenilin family intramembrane aspartyl protease [archaeon]|nr:presenilin family intramembrane aspartyl protease [archaeon]